MLSGLKTPIAFLLLVALTYQCLGSLGVFAWYEVNRDFIAANWCVNRDKPMLHCDGKCILAQKLRKLDESGHQKDSHDTSGIQKPEVPALTAQYHIVAPAGTARRAEQSIPKLSSRYSFLPDTDIFHPPICLV